jgi:hypothetical protein
MDGCRATISLSVIAGLVPAISTRKARAIFIEMAGTGPAMTISTIVLGAGAHTDQEGVEDP